MKRLKRILALLSCLIVLVAGLAVTASAASYPLLISDVTSSQTIPEGEVGTLRFTMFHEFTNEKYHVEIYDASGNMMGSASGSVYNYSVYFRDITITVDTKKLELGVGTYTVKYWTSFYSLYEWHDSPNQRTTTFKVIKNTCKSKHNIVDVSWLTEGTCSKEGTIKVRCTKCEYWAYEERLADHTYGNTCTQQDAATHQRTCTDCGATKSESHNWGKGVVTYPTQTANGYTTFTCTGCGYSKVENYTFPDVRNNAWHYNAVEFAVRKGYFSGHGDGTFGPSQGISRQDFVLVMSRISGADMSQYTGQTSFTDVKPNAYYAKAIQWATENGVINGYNATTFGVGDKLTREQLVTILQRYAKKMGCDTSVTDQGRELMNSYPDARDVNPNMRDAVAWALQNGVIGGMQVNGVTSIAPRVSATRAQVAQILMNINAKGTIPGI